MSDPDVVVVGGGLGGITAALTAAEDATVQLVAPRTHPFDAHAGLIDVLGYRDGDLVTNPLNEVDELQAGHPYRTVGKENLIRGLEIFDNATGVQYHGTDRTRNGLVPTAIGSYRPAYRYPKSIAAGLLGSETPLTLVGFDHLADFDPFYAAERFRAHDLPAEVEAIQVTLPIEPHDGPPAQRIAAAMDRNEEIGRGVPIRDSVVRSIRAQLVEAERLGFPAVLGSTNAPSVRSKLADELDTHIFEIPLGPPSFVGRRLEIQLWSALQKAGITVDRETDVSGIETESDHIRRVDLSDGRSTEPAAVVLAPGGLTGGGLEAQRDGIAEPRFGCPVRHPPDREDWTSAIQLDDHELAAAGVQIDHRARPVESSGDPVYDNLVAAGRVIGGGNFVAQHAVSGIALATGVAAGRTATGLD